MDRTDLPEVLVLDFDGVITDLDMDWKGVMREVRKKTGISFTNFLDLWKKIAHAKAFANANRIVEEREMEAIRHIKPYPDIIKVLEGFKGHVYIASMQSLKPIRAFLDANRMAGFFTEVLARDGFVDKRAQLKHVMEKERGKRVLFVDDMRIHVRTARSLGMQAVLFDRSRGDTLSY